MVPQKCLQESVPILSSLRLACIEGTLFAATDGLSNLVLVGHSFGISAACHLSRWGLGGGTRSWGGIGEGLFALDGVRAAGEFGKGQGRPLKGCWPTLLGSACLRLGLLTPIRPHPKTQHLPPPCVSKM